MDEGEEEEEIAPPFHKRRHNHHHHGEKEEGGDAKNKELALAKLLVIPLKGGWPTTAATHTTSWE